ncbi:phage major tail tube protein [Vibrio sp. TRT 17S01]|uniref:phage major tail tube protein n=1 Tax=Vibrio sp. TRT 17S01 TaxID=3418505 RepID=UPI003CF42CAA
MADRIRLRLSALLEGLPLMNEINEFNAPEISYKMVGTEGSFVETEDAVRLNKLSWSMKVNGDHLKIAQTLGKYMTKPGQLNLLEQGKTTEGVAYKEEHSLYTIINSVKPDAKKMGEKPSVTIEGVCKAYTLRDTGVVVHDINSETGKCVVFGTDLMGEAGIT